MKTQFTSQTSTGRSDLHRTCSNEFIWNVFSCCLERMIRRPIQRFSSSIPVAQLPDYEWAEWNGVDDKWINLAQWNGFILGGIVDHFSRPNSCWLGRKKEADPEIELQSLGHATSDMAFGTRNFDAQGNGKWGPAPIEATNAYRLFRDFRNPYLAQFRLEVEASRGGTLKIIRIMCRNCCSHWCIALAPCVCVCAPARRKSQTCHIERWHGLIATHVLAQ